MAWGQCRLQQVDSCGGGLRSPSSPPLRARSFQLKRQQARSYPLPRAEAGRRFGCLAQPDLDAQSWAGEQATGAFVCG